jgi:uncharacterized protein (TIGR03437 family)
MTKLNVVISWIVGAALLSAEKPVIFPKGVVNAASFDGSVKGNSAAVGGAIFSIFGENLATSEHSATSTPLPRALGGTSVTVDGIAAPLFYVSPTQVNFQVPRAVAERASRFNLAGEPITVVVTTTKGTSDPELVDVERRVEGVFSQRGSGCGPGVIQNVAPDGTVSLNTASNSASPGSVVTIYGTGFGPVYSPPDDGEPASVQELSGIDPPGAYLGISGFRSWETTRLWAGLTPGLVGVGQVNQRLPDDAPEGCAVPFHVGAGPPVTMSIRRGGGACHDAAPARFATIHWRKTVTTSPGLPTAESQAAFTASFASGPENLTEPVPENPDPPAGGCVCGSLPEVKSIRCKGAGLSPLDAGLLTLEGLPGGPLAVLPSGSAGEYSTALPAGSLEGGRLRVVGVGGSGVGAFQTEITTPPLIRVDFPLAPGTVIDFRRPFALEWSGGSSDTIVSMRLIARLEPGGVFGRVCECRTLGNAGRVLLDVFNPNPQTGGPVLLIGSPSEDAEVLLTVTPRPSGQTLFTAPGLTRGARHEWSYEYQFKGLKIK